MEGVSFIRKKNELWITGNEKWKQEFLNRDQLYSIKK